MGIRRRLRAKVNGVSVRTYEILEALEPQFKKTLRGDPELSMDLLSIFATEHGKSSYEELSDEQVQDFATLLEGLWFPMHPNDMERNGKFGCQVCKDLYLEMFRAKVRPIAGNAKAGKQTDIDELPPEVLDKLIQKMDQHDKFLSGD